MSAILRARARAQVDASLEAALRPLPI